MAKLPDVQYRSGVPSLGHYDPGQALAVGNAKARAYLSMGRAVSAVGKAGMSLYEDYSARQAELAVIEADKKARGATLQATTERNVDVSTLSGKVIYNKDTVYNNPDGSLKSERRQTVPGEEVGEAQWNARILGIREATMAGLTTDRSKELFAKEFDRRSGIMGIRVQQQMGVWARDTMQQDVQAKLQILEEKGNLAGGIALIEANTPIVFGAAKAEQLKAAYRDQIEKRPVYKAIAMGADGIPQLRLELEKFSAKDYSGPLNEKQRAEMVGVISRGLTAASNARDKIIGERQADFTSQKSVEIIKGNPTVTPSAIDEWRDTGRIDEQQRFTLYRQLNARTKKIDDDAVVQDYLNKGRKMNVGNAAHVKGVNARANDIIEESMAESNTQSRVKGIDLSAGKLLKLTGDTGIVSQPLKDLMVGLGASSSTSEVDTAVRIRNALQTRSPGLLVQLGGSMKNVDRLAGLAALGYSTSEAVEQVALMDATTVDEKRVYSAQLSAQVKPGEFGDLLVEGIKAKSDLLGGIPIFGGGADPSPQMVAEFEIAYRQQYVATRGLNGGALAAQLATDRVMRDYGRNDADDGPDRAMKYAPQSLYQMSDKLVQTDLNRQLKEQAGVKLESSDVILQADEGSPRGAGYRVWDTEKWELVRNLDSTEFRYVPNPAETERRSELQELEKAQKAQDAIKRDKGLPRRYQLSGASPTELPEVIDFAAETGEMMEQWGP